MKYLWQKFIKWLYGTSNTKGMKIMIQWAKKNPTGWEEIDSHAWKDLPKLPIPAKGQKGGQSDQLGWIRNVNIQGLTCEGYDHIAVEPVVIGNDEGVKLTVWNDDPDDAHVPGIEDWVNEPQAIEWTIMPLAPDPKLGMAINTRQYCKRYATGERYSRLLAHPPQNTTVRPLADFVPPNEEIARHGVWLDDMKFAEHLSKAPQAEWGWMHWCDHLPESETELETEITIDRVVRTLADPRRKLKGQRAQGRYKQAEHTITYYQTDDTRATGVHVSNIEQALQTSTKSAASQSRTTDANAVLMCVRTTVPNQPNSGDWPNGTYNYQTNCTAASGGLTYGLLTLGGVAGHFARVDSGLTTDSETIEQAEAAFSGTGLKLATASWNPATGVASDRYEGAFVASGDSHGDAITIEVGPADSYADGPWTVASTNPPTDYQDLIITS